MATVITNSAFRRHLSEMNQSHTELAYSMLSYSALDTDDILLETAEIMAHNEDFFLHNGPALRLGLV